ncbi:MAG: hypothetical protein JKY51_07145 [Opitutaceae bacterium]|nr:hypothetical protein [Opitutaceae bacterium]
MNLEETHTQIVHTLERMREFYGSPVFNEWAIVSVENNRGTVLTYEGPRAADFKTRFPLDMVLLNEELKLRPYDTGDFAFAIDAEGTRFDVFVIVAPQTYLILNNTEAAMSEIRANPLWLKAQVPFANLCMHFQDSAMALAS